MNLVYPCKQLYSSLGFTGTDHQIFGEQCVYHACTFHHLYAHYYKAAARPSFVPFCVLGDNFVVGDNLCMGGGTGFENDERCHKIVHNSR